MATPTNLGLLRFAHRAPGFALFSGMATGIDLHFG